MGQRGVPKPLVLVVASGAGGDLNTTGQAVSALRRLASNGDNAVVMVRVSYMLEEKPKYFSWSLCLSVESAPCLRLEHFLVVVSSPICYFFSDCRSAFFK